MKFRDPKNWGALIGAGVLATLAVLPEAHAELIYDDQIQQQPAAAPAAPAARVEDRETTRQVIRTSQKAEATLQQAPQVVSQPIMLMPATQPAVSTPPVTAEIQNLSKSELMRRERMREEMKNEDVLQERLEALRLKDEQKRSDQILAMPATNAVAPATATLPMKEEVISQGMAPTAVVVASATPVKSDQISTAQAASVTSADASTSAPAEKKTTMIIAPRGGLTEINATSQFNISPRFTAGLGLAVAASDNVIMEVGYSYSEFGVSNNSIGASTYVQPGLPNNAFQSLVMKQNVFDLGLKVYILGADSKIRPFIGGGGAYAKTFVNYDPTITNFYNSVGQTQMTQDVQLASFLGYLSTGIDVQVTKSVSVGAMFKYYQVLSSTNQYQNPTSPYGYAGGYSPDMDKQMLGSSVQNSSFHTITAGVNFSL